MLEIKLGPSAGLDGSSRSRKRGYQASPWCNSAGKRAFDLICALLLLVLGLPLLFLVAVLVRATSRSSIFFRQFRCGKAGKEFQLLKFRTMRDRQESAGPGVTRLGDKRVTPVGRYLRRWKLDELPQIFNVLGGTMSLVGPRPDLSEYWERLGSRASAVLSVRPGITGPATLEFCNEEAWLGRLPENEIENFYVTTVLPLKVDRDLEYLEQASFRSDLGILFQTLACVLGGKSRASDSSEK